MSDTREDFREATEAIRDKARRATGGVLMSPYDCERFFGVKPWFDEFSQRWRLTLTEKGES